MTDSRVTPQAAAEKSMRVALEDMTCMITADGMRSATADIIAAAPAVLAELSRLRATLASVEEALVLGGQTAAIRAQQALFALHTAPVGTSNPTPGGDRD